MPKTFKILPKRWRFTKSGHTSGTQGLIPRNEEIAFFCEKWNGDRTELKVDAPKRMIDRDSNCALQSSHPYYQLKNINHIVLYLFPLILSISHSSSWFSQSRSMFKRNKQKWAVVVAKLTERSLPTTEAPSSDPVSLIYMESMKIQKRGR